MLVLHIQVYVMYYIHIHMLHTYLPPSSDNGWKTTHKLGTNSTSLKGYMYACKYKIYDMLSKFCSEALEKIDDVEQMLRETNEVEWVGSK
jgi:hypothetical protein